MIVAQRNRVTTRVRHKYRWWQWILRIAAAAGVIIVLLYASVTLWLPTEWVARRLEADLASQLGTAVTVGDLSVSWKRGVRIASITLADPTGAVNGPMLTTGTVRADFSPIRLMLARRLTWLQIESPEIHLAPDEAGRWNITALKGGASDIRIGEINIQRGAVRLPVVGEGPPLHLEIADLQCRAGYRWLIESVTGSAALVHGSRRAPLGLTIAVPQSPTLSARPVLKCTFTGVDLAQLDLSHRLDLPLAKVEGVCAGALNLPVIDGMISKATASLTVEGLVVEPVGGPALPTIQTAGVQLAGDVDLATRQVDIRSFQLRGPGIELSGSARFHASFLAGYWLSGRQLAVTGTVNPRALSAVLRGSDRPALDPYDVAGDVHVTIAYTRRADDIKATLDVDATAAEVADDDAVIKPAGETLQCSLSAQCDPLTWQFVVDRTELRLGGNHFIGRGALANVRRLLADWFDPDRRWTLQTIGQHMAGLDWVAEWEITELDSLRRLGPTPRRLLAETRFAGRMTGTARLKHEQSVRLRVDAACEPQSQLRVGDWFDKPPGLPLAAAADFAYDADSGTVTESVLDLTCGDGRVSARFTDVVLVRATEAVGGPLGGWVADIRGTAHVDHMEHMVAGISPVAEWADRLAGEASGDFAVELGYNDLRIVAEIDATPSRIRVGDVVDKSPGEPVRLSGRGVWNWPRNHTTVDVDAVVPGAKVNGRWSGRADEWDAAVDVAVTNAAWLSEQVPWLTRADSPVLLAGAADLRVDLTGRGDVIEVEGEVAADDLLLDLRRRDRRKQIGVPLRAQIVAALDRSAGAGRVNVTDATLMVGGVALQVAGAVRGGETIEDTHVDLSGMWSLSLDDSIPDLLPDLHRRTDPIALTGSARGRYHLRGVLDSFQIDGDADGSALAARAAFGATALDKPAGMPADLAWSAAVADRLTQVTVSDWSGRLGPIHAIGDLRLALASPDGADDWSATSHVRLQTSSPDQLAGVLGDLAELHLAGAARLEGQFTCRPGRIEASYVRADLDDFSFLHRGRRVVVGGTATLSDIAPAAPADRWPVRIGRVSSDGIKLSVADQHVTMVADLYGLPGSPRGTADVFGGQIDAGDLGAWLAGPTQLPEQTDEYTRQLVDGVTAAVDVARDWIIDSEVTLRVGIDQVRNVPDATVNRVYDANNVAVSCTLNRGQVRIRSAIGVNGGTMIDRFRTDLTEPGPTLHHVQNVLDMMATENLQPQIARFFPGNEVHGAMWREMDLRLSLIDALANAIDPRHPAIPEGQGKTTLIDGITRGRAAPRYVTALFPGLNLVAYPYERVVAFTEFHADGSAYNDMIYTGKRYNMYIEGATDADHVARYDVGLILAPTRDQAEWQHRYKQGRIPLLQQKLKIVDGTKTDEVVSYPWPNETMSTIFIKNNYFYRLWLQRRSRDNGAK